MENLAFDLAPKQCLVTLTKNNKPRKYILRESAEGIVCEGSNYRYSKARVSSDGKTIEGWDDMFGDDLIILGGSLFDAVVTQPEMSELEHEGVHYKAGAAVGTEFVKNMPDRVYRTLRDRLNEFNEIKVVTQPPHDPKAAPELTQAISA